MVRAQKRLVRDKAVRRLGGSNAKTLGTNSSGHACCRNCKTLSVFATVVDVLLAKLPRRRAYEADSPMLRGKVGRTPTFGAATTTVALLPLGRDKCWSNNRFTIDLFLSWGGGDCCCHGDVHGNDDDDIFEPLYPTIPSRWISTTHQYAGLEMYGSCVRAPRRRLAYRGVQ
jgi:hypothetical protein